MSADEPRDEVAPKAEVTTEDFDFTVEPADASPVEIVETIDESAIAGMHVARCN